MPSDGIVYWVRMSDDFCVPINRMDEVGDIIQDMLQAEKKADNLGGELLGKP